MAGIPADDEAALVRRLSGEPETGGRLGRGFSAKERGVNDPWTIAGSLLVAALALGLVSLPLLLAWAVLSRRRWAKRIRQHNARFEQHQRDIRRGGRPPSGRFKL